MAVEHPQTVEPKDWHRFFAVENNNLAWALATQATRTADESRKMLESAHASALHWREVGTELNVMRARMLLAEVYALVDFGAQAIEESRQVRSYFLNRETDDWELGFVHAIHAHAAAVAGLVDEHRESYLAARLAIDAIADDEDRRLVLETFSQVSVPDGM